MPCGHLWAHGEWTRWSVTRSHASNSIYLPCRSKPPRARLSSRTMGQLYSRAFRLYIQPQKWQATHLTGRQAQLINHQLVDLSAAQDVEAGDGTTSVVVLA